MSGATKIMYNTPPNKKTMSKEDELRFLGETFNELVNNEPEEEKWRDDVEWRNANRNWLGAACEISLDILDAMDRLGLIADDLSRESGIPMKRVNEILSGRANMTLKEIADIGDVLKSFE